jgi:hypothetical protein
MSGPPPKPAHLRQRTNRKAGSGTIQAPQAPQTREIPNPDGRTWQPLTIASWKRAWASPMASRWLDTDADALGRLAILWDAFYKQPDARTLAEIRLQEQRFGLSPLDRTRLQWEVTRGDEAAKRQRQRQPLPSKKVTRDPRAFLKAVK